MIRFFEYLLKYFLVPIGTWSASLYTGLSLIGHPAAVTHILLPDIWMLLALAALAYETGYKGFYVAGKKAYFLVVFIIPILVGIVGLLVGILSS